MTAGARHRRRPETRPGRQTTLGPGASTVLRATVAEIALANEGEHGELASSAPSAREDADPDGVAYAAEYHGSEYDDEYVTVEEFTGAGRGIAPNLVVCPCVEEGAEQWTVSVRRPASVAGVDSKRQATERQRDRLFRDFVLPTVGGYLVKLQGAYLDSGNPADLEPISQKDIAANIDKATERTGERGDRPGRWKIDKTARCWRADGVLDRTSVGPGRAAACPGTESVGSIAQVHCGGFATGGQSGRRSGGSRRERRPDSASCGEIRRVGEHHQKSGRGIPLGAAPGPGAADGGVSEGRGLVDAQKVLMVGVEDEEFTREVNARLGGTGDKVVQLPGVMRLDAAGEDERERVARFRIAIVAESQFANWITWPLRSEGDGKGVRPPHFILVSEFEVHRQDDLFWGDPGTLGYGTARQLEVVTNDIARMLAGPADEGAGEGRPIPVGACVVGGGGAKRRSFGGLRCGRTGKTLLELRRTAQSGRWREDVINKARVELFGRVKPREWLDMYVGILAADLPDCKDVFQTALGARDLKKLLGTGSGALAYNPLVLNTFQKMFMEPQGPTEAVLVLGETGTGKSIAAWELHRLRARRLGIEAEDLPFRHVNCSGLGTMDSMELFGAMKGAYTDSSVTNPGAVFSAYGGTVFLDEFGNLSPRGQENLLVFLEDGSMKPMGWWGASMRVPTMLVAATNERLTDRIAAGEFREDLYRRFRDRIVTLPPLREIKNEELHYFVDDLVQRENRAAEGQEITELTQAAFDRLLSHDYPGNVRELEGVMAKAVRKAREARRRRIVRSDVEFEASTLPSADAVVAVIRDREKRVLLRWSSGWEMWFFPARRVGDNWIGECLESALKELQVSQEDVERAEIMQSEKTLEAARRGVSSCRLIQYSRRDRKTKHYHFYLYEVVLKAESLAELQRRLDGRGDCVWVEEETLRGGEMGDVSGTVQLLLRQFSPSAAKV